MAIDAETLSAAETLRKTRTFGKVRCHNPSCMERLEPLPGSDRIKCATCGMEFRIYWVRPDLPRIRGPVWEVNRKIASDALSRKIAADALSRPKDLLVETSSSQSKGKEGA